jgi:hypothetical protein
MGELTDSNEIKLDTLFKYCGQSEYRIIPNEAYNFTQFKNDSLHIKKVFWTSKYGLTGYELRNGKILTLEI